VRVTESQIRSAGLTGVPSFVVNRRLAVSGVHDPALLVSVIDKALFHELPEEPTPSQLH
jgi:predicted DsbA family dithiol-disulfide isomerase